MSDDYFSDIRKMLNENHAVKTARVLLLIAFTMR